MVENKVVLVTGASFGIGRSLALKLGEAGALTLLVARSQEQLQEVQGSILEAGGRASIYPCDLRDADSVESVAEQIIAQHQSVDIVVHNAGKSIRRSLHNSLDRAHDFERTMGVNYLGPVRLQLALLPGMIERGAGQIINVSAVNVRLPATAHWAAYHCSKSAFDLWVAAAAPELRLHKICCTSVYLGLVHTRMSAPTRAYASLPGQTAEQAASVVCRAIVRRPRIVQPWWLGPAHWLSVPLERPFEWAQALFLR